MQNFEGKKSSLGTPKKKWPSMKITAWPELKELGAKRKTTTFESVAATPIYMDVGQNGRPRGPQMLV